MNYRHAYHAGNFADCMKHALLVALLRAVQEKPAPIFVLDTHAGLGSYDLSDAPARRTGEHRDGIDRLRADPPAELADYVGLVGQIAAERAMQPQGEPAFGHAAHYPGSPALIRALLREHDRLACCELHPEDAAVLRRHFARDRQVAVHRRDGWQAVRALLPPAGLSRGLVLIDPPFESGEDYARIVAAMADARARFAGGVVAAWYPIKHRAPVHALHLDIRAAGVARVIAAELWLRPPLDPARLNGCGLLIAGAPWGFEAVAEPILTALVARLATEAGAGHSMLRITSP